MADAIAMGMENEHRTLLRKNRVGLVKDLEAVKLLNHLASVFSEDDEEDIRGCKGRSEQAEKLLDILPKKGPNAFLVFIRALEDKQPHLAKPLLEQADMSPASAKDDEHTMSTKHREILRSSREMLQDMNLNKILPFMGIILDQDDREIITSNETSSGKFNEFMTILPRKGPRAFEHFVMILEMTYPSYARMLLKEAGIKPIIMLEPSGPIVSNSKDPVESNHVALDHPKQESSKPNCEKLVAGISTEKMANFFNAMNERSRLLGTGWERLGKEFEFPSDALEKLESNKNPTSVVVETWCKRDGRKATVGHLIGAVNRIGRKDCVTILEDDLGCKLDTVDAPIDYLTTKTRAMKIDNSRRKTPFYLQDLDRENLSCIARQIDSIDPADVRGLLKEGCSPTVSTLELLCDLLGMQIRDLTKVLRSCNRTDVILCMREYLPSGITGPLLSEIKKVRDMPYSTRGQLTIALCGDDSWKRLADYLGLSRDQINYFDNRTHNPADEVLRVWEVKTDNNIGELYDILVKLQMPYIADKL